MPLHRRQLLAMASAGLVASAFSSPEVSRSAVKAPKKLVLVMASGGWDPTYCLDPRPGSALVDAPLGVMRNFSNIPILTHAERPSVTSFFERYADLSAVVNGIQVRSFVHSDCMKRILTGTPSELNPDLAAITAFELGKDLPVPYFVLGNSALSGPLASFTGRAGTTNQMNSLLRADETPDFLLPTPGYRATDAEEALVQSHLKASGERLRAVRGQQGSNAKALEAFSSSLDRRGLLQAFAKSQGTFGERQYTPDLGVQVRVALDALSADLSQAVMLESLDWDTHQTNSLQSAKHEALYLALLELAAGLASRQLLDKTVVVVMSEMGRTPRLNDAQGKDHWPITSALVFGAGIKGGNVFGATNEAQGALNIDFQTGRVLNAGKQVQTGNLLAGLLGLVGVNAEPYLAGLEPFSAFVA